MLDKKMVAVVVALTLLSATLALGASNLIVNGSGIKKGTAIEAELLYNEYNGPRILVITDANSYLFNGVINTITADGSAVEFSVTDSITGNQYRGSATRTNLNTWTLKIIDWGEESYELTGRLQIIIA